MPFGKSNQEKGSFTGIYNQYRTILERHGFEVQRADDIRSSQNVMKDVVSAIARCHLIIADLTGQNSNVLYELGLAHAFHKPTIILTQDKLNTLPFDTKSYRVIKYGRDFQEMKKASDSIDELVKNESTLSLYLAAPSRITLVYPLH